jgi:hypothetical protein
MQSQLPNSDTLNGKKQEEKTDEKWDNLISPNHGKTIRKLRTSRLIII